MNKKLLTEHHLEFLSLKRDSTGLSEPIHVKMPHCWLNFCKFVPEYSVKLSK